MMRTTDQDVAALPTVSTPRDADGRPIVPISVQGIEGEALSWISFEHEDRKWQFAVSGVEAPFLVSYLQTFDRADGREAMFTIAPEHAALEPMFFEEQLYDQLTEIHRRRMAASELASELDSIS